MKRAIADAHLRAIDLGASGEPGRIIWESSTLSGRFGPAGAPGATLLSSLGVEQFGWERLSAPLRLHPLQVPEDGARVDPEVLRGLGAVAAVPLEHFVDVTLLPLVARLRERQ